MGHCPFSLNYWGKIKLNGVLKWVLSTHAMHHLVKELGMLIPRRMVIGGGFSRDVLIAAKRLRISPEEVIEQYQNVQKSLK